MPKMEYRDVMRGGENVQLPFPIGYAPMCCIVCGDVVGGEFKDLEDHYRKNHQDASLQTFPCQWCTKPTKTAAKRNRHERRYKNKPKNEMLL